MAVGPIGRRALAPQAPCGSEIAKTAWTLEGIWR